MRQVIIVALVGLMGIGVAWADVVRGIDIDFVTIGNAGNAADITGYGAVNYTYQIGKFEITQAQWSAFVSAAGAPAGNDHNGQNPYDVDQSGNPAGSEFYDPTGIGDCPTNNLSWYEAAQFCNYLTSGDKSKGAYQFDGNNTNPGNFLGIDRISSISTYGIAYVIPTEDEWYKAAYFKHNASGYSLYANGTDTAPSTSQARYDVSSSWYVGTGTIEQNGTFDMMGNIIEWTENLAYDSFRIVRGGNYNAGNVLDLSSYSEQSCYGQYYEGPVGFRVASVPEPCSLIILAFGGLILRRTR